MSDDLERRRAERDREAPGPGSTRPTATFPGHPLWLRVVLYVTAVAELAIGIPLAVLAGSVHLVRDGTLACLLGVILVVIAVRPRWSRPLTVVAVAVFVLQVVGSSGDIAAGRVHPAFELTHLVGALGVIAAVVATVKTRPRLDF